MQYLLLDLTSVTFGIFMEGKGFTYGLKAELGVLPIFKFESEIRIDGLIYYQANKILK